MKYKSCFLCCPSGYNKAEDWLVWKNYAYQFRGEGKWWCTVSMQKRIFCLSCWIVQCLGIAYNKSSLEKALFFHSWTISKIYSPPILDSVIIKQWDFLSHAAIVLPQWSRSCYWSQMDFQNHHENAEEPEIYLKFFTTLEKGNPFLSVNVKG